MLVLEEGRITVVKASQHLKVLTGVDVDTAMLPKVNLGEIVETGIGECSEQRMPPGDRSQQGIVIR